MTRDESIALMIRIEGGYVNNPKDPGGATKYGITQRTLFSLRYNSAMPQFVSLPTSVADLTPEQATAIYRTVDWDVMRCDEFPASLACLMLNSAVNQGEPAAVRLLQETLCITVDGIVGEVTLAAVRIWHSPYMPEQSLTEEYAARVAVRYARLDGSEDEFELGWFRRLFRVYTEAIR